MIRSALIFLSALTALSAPFTRGLSGPEPVAPTEPGAVPASRPGVASQDARTDDRPVPRAELGFATFDLSGMNQKQVQGLLRLAEDLAGNRVDLEDGTAQRRFQAVGNQVFVIDDAVGRERALAVLRELAATIVGAGDEDPIPEPETRLWSPVHLSSEAAVLAAEGLLYGEVLPIAVPNTLLLRAAPEDLDRVWPLLQELDAPRPQLTVELLVLGGVGEPDDASAGDALPADLREGLAALLPHANFTVLAGASLRTSAGQRQLRLLSAIGDAAEIGLEIGELAFDARNGLAVLRECRLGLTPLNSDVYPPVDLSTTLDAPLGEHLVVSSVGRRDLFFVLRVVAN